jgi:hypothetical protein
MLFFLLFHRGIEYRIGEWNWNLSTFNPSDCLKTRTLCLLQVSEFRFHPFTELATLQIVTYFVICDILHSASPSDDMEPEMQGEQY